MAEVCPYTPLRYICLDGLHSVPEIIMFRTPLFAAAFLIVTNGLLTNSTFAQSNPILPETSVKVSDHVWAIMGFPNVAIVVGANAALVVDTGLGPRNGTTITKEVAKLFKGQKLYLTTTHFHPEHASGEAGFPPNTILIRPAVQQQEMNEHGAEMLSLFSGRTAQYKELLDAVKLRQPDLVFDTETKLDLGGGVTARLIWTGGGHTLGDEFIYIEPDQTLITGDLVQNNVMPSFAGEPSSVKRWIASLDKLGSIQLRFVVPDHSAVGDGSLLGKQKTFLSDLQKTALDLKRQGKTAEQAAQQMATDMTAKYPAYNITPNLMTALVRKVYSEN